MNVLVTGGAGLIGMALRQALTSAGHGVVAIDITDFGRSDPTLELVALTDASALDRLVYQHDADAIVHCGAISGPMLARGNPQLLVDANVDGTARVLDLARRHAMRRFVFCSSIAVYGSAGAGVVIDEAKPFRPTSVYGASKVAAECLVEGFAAEYGVDAVSLRIARVYGPYRRANCYLGDIIRDAAAGRTTTIPCAPAFNYHYVYVDDVVSAIIAALEAPSLPARAYNISGARPETMPEIVATAREVIAGARIDLVPGMDEVSDIQDEFDIGAFARDIGWRPQFDIARGLAAYRNAIQSGHAA